MRLLILRSRIAWSILFFAVFALEQNQEAQASLLDELNSVMPAVVNLEIIGPLHVHKGKTGKIHPAKSRGSGFIISDDGLILTNEHVVGKAKTIHVHFQDGTKRVATRLGTDVEADVALLQVDLSGMSIIPLELDESDDVQPGMSVIAIGNPKGLHHSVSAGIVSGLHRDTIRPRKGHRYSDFIQTDTAINKGSSGGPLLSSEGKVIGMVTAIKKNSDGLAFAIPAGWLRVICARLQEGSLQRSWLGVSLQQVVRGPQANQGTQLEIKRVVADSPAAEAGLQAGDKIRAANGKPVVSVSGFSFDVSMIRSGESLDLEIVRKGEELRFSIPVEMRKAHRGKKGKPFRFFSEEEVLNAWGISVSQKSILSDLIVKSVGDGSPAQKAGLLAEDQIVSLGSGEHLTVSGLVRATLRAQKTRVIEVEVLRKSRRYYVPVYLP